MIANTEELKVAFRNLGIFEQTLEGLRKELLASNPSLFPIVAQGYLRQIQKLESDISAYQSAHPAEFLLILSNGGTG